MRPNFDIMTDGGYVGRLPDPPDSCGGCIVTLVGQVLFFVCLIFLNSFFRLSYELLSKNFSQIFLYVSIFLFIIIGIIIVFKKPIIGLYLQLSVGFLVIAPIFIPSLKDTVKYNEVAQYITGILTIIAIAPSIIMYHKKPKK